MKRLVYQITVIVAMLLQATAHSQNKTIFIPPSILTHDGRSLACKIDNVSFYADVKGGNIVALVAQTPGETNIPVTCTSPDNEKKPVKTGGVKVECQACIQIKDGKGNYVTQCYDIDCKATKNLKTATPAVMVASLNFPTKPVTGSYSVLKTADYELFAEYTGSVITNYSAKSFKNEKIQLEYSGAGGDNTTAKETAVCFIRIKRTLPDGTVINTTQDIPCNKMPKPKGSTSTR